MSDCNSSDGQHRLPDGRVLGYRVFGAHDVYPVLALHGTPGSRLKFRSMEAAASERGLKLIAVDRWGYGLSSPHPNARLSAFGDDTASLMGELNIATAAIVGISGGGPFAVAASAALGRRNTALALFAPVGPIETAPGAVTLSGLHQLCFGVAPLVPGMIGAAFLAVRWGLISAPEGTMDALFALSAPVDRATLKDDVVRNGLIAAFAEGLRQGGAGPAEDVRLFSAPWDFAVERAVAPARVWIGSADRQVPMAAIGELARRLPSAEVTSLPDAGHLWIATQGHQVLDWVVARLEEQQMAKTKTEP